MTTPWDPDLRLGRWQDALADVGECDLLCVDAPYSARTHAAHGRDDAAVQRMPNPNKAPKPIPYDGWTDEDVRSFVDAWSPRTRGWFVTITDHTLAPVWSEALASHGRYVFAPLPWVAKGSRIRLRGDGPSSWTCWIVVARPRTGTDRNGRQYSKWGTLPGAYVITSERGSHIGGKPERLMRALVRDYSRPGDLVCDPCAGYGTTLIAAANEGRRSVGSEMDEETHATGLQRIARGVRQGDLMREANIAKAISSELPF